MVLSVAQGDARSQLEGATLQLDEAFADHTIRIARVDEQGARVVLSAEDRPVLDRLKTHLSAPSTLTVTTRSRDEKEQLTVEAVEEPTDGWDYAQSPEGPPERRRLWIACATKKWGEELLVPLCKGAGAMYRFYHSGVGAKSMEGTSAKEDVKDTSASWRRIHVVISTTTIMPRPSVTDNFNLLTQVIYCARPCASRPYHTSIPFVMTRAINTPSLSTSGRRRDAAAARRPLPPCQFAGRAHGPTIRAAAWPWVQSWLDRVHDHVDDAFWQVAAPRGQPSLGYREQPRDHAFSSPGAVR